MRHVLQSDVPRSIKFTGTSEYKHESLSEDRGPLRVIFVIAQVGNNFKSEKPFPNLSRKRRTQNRTPEGTSKSSQTTASGTHGADGTTTTRTPNCLKKAGCVAGRAASWIEPAAEGRWPSRRTGPDGSPTDGSAARQTGGRHTNRQAARKQRGAGQEGGRRPGHEGGRTRHEQTGGEADSRKSGGSGQGASGQPQGRKQQGKGGEARHAADGAARARHEKVRSTRLTHDKIRTL